MLNHIHGQIFILFNKTENQEPLKIIKKFNNKSNNIKIKLIYLYERIFINEEINKIINLKTKEIECGKLIRYLNMPLIKLLNTLKIIIDKKKEENNDN